jgi:protein KRI1
MSRLDILGEGETSNSLQVNAKFAEQFERRKRREEIQKAKERAKELGVDFDNLDEDSSESSEDSEAELVTSKVNSKFLEVMSLIRKRDPKLKDPNYHTFSDSDFDDAEPSEKKDKPVRYRDLYTQTLLEEGADNSLVNETESKVVPTPIEEQRRLRADFIRAAEDVAEDDLLSVRKKTKAQRQAEEDDFQSFLETQAPEAKVNAEDLRAYWTEKQDNDDQFLKDYIIKQR